MLLLLSAAIISLISHQCNMQARAMDQHCMVQDTAEIEQKMFPLPHISYNLSLKGK